MLALISPAKKLDAENEPPLGDFTVPQLLDNSEELVDTVKGLGEGRLKALMNLSDSLTELNHARYERYSTPFTPSNAKQAVFMFRGDTYVGLDADTLSKDDLTYAQTHLGILSGLYGVLRPLDLIQPYRLEMGSKLSTQRGEDLYDFWGSRLTDACNEVTASHNNRTVVSLASKEYIGAIQPQGLAGPFRYLPLQGDEGRRAQDHRAYRQEGAGKDGSFYCPEPRRDPGRLEGLRRGWLWLRARAVER